MVSRQWMMLGAYRGSCKVTSGAPTHVEKNILNATIHCFRILLVHGGEACCSRIRGGISLVDTANIKALPSLDQEVAAEAFPEYSLNGN